MTRSYESNGPDVKVRGTAQHVAEKYLQLARDAQSSGDPVMAESYLQHAEHYFRLIAAAMLAQQQQQVGYVRGPGEGPESEDSDEDDEGDIPDRFASPFERSQPVFNPPQPSIPNQPPPYPERQPQAERPPMPDRGPRPDRPERHDRQDRPDRPNHQRDFRDQRNQRDRNFGNQRPSPMLNEPQPVDVAQPVAALPAFITGGVPRPAPMDSAPAIQPEVAPRFEAEHDNAAFHLRNRRRRRPRGAEQEGPENGDSAGERPTPDELPAGE